jgi:predicted double-glycine peptidase
MTVCGGLLGVIPPALASQGTVHEFYGVADVPQFNKRITSLRERRYQDIIQQRFDFSCGAAAAATILRYAYDMDVSEVDVILGLAKVADEELAREKGYSLLDIRHYVETLGLRGRGYELPPEMLPKLHIPTIALLNLRGYKHFVVLRRVTEDSVYVGDPALGNRIMPLSDFKKSWNGSVFAILGRGYDRDTVLSRPAPPLTARKFLYNYSPVTDSELLDFGFTHADLF